MARPFVLAGHALQCPLSLRNLDSRQLDPWRIGDDAVDLSSRQPVGPEDIRDVPGPDRIALFLDNLRKCFVTRGHHLTVLLVLRCEGDIGRQRRSLCCGVHYAAEHVGEFCMFGESARQNNLASVRCPYHDLAVAWLEQGIPVGLSQHQRVALVDCERHVGCGWGGRQRPQQRGAAELYSYRMDVNAVH